MSNFVKETRNLSAQNLSQGSSQGQSQTQNVEQIELMMGLNDTFSSTLLNKYTILQTSEIGDLQVGIVLAIDKLEFDASNAR